MLANALTALTGKVELKRLVEAHYFDLRRTPPLDKVAYIRASGFSGLCAREEVLVAQHQLVREQRNEPHLMLTFLHGKSLHWGLQNELLPALGVLYGKWKCLGDHCGATYGGVHNLVLRPTNCTHCGSTEFVYRELFFHDKVSGLGGHPDGFLKMVGLPGMGLLEAKSIASAREVRTSPNIEHVVQAQIYMVLTRTLWTKIVYWEKTAPYQAGADCLIEHYVEHDADTAAAIWDLAHTIRKGIEAGPAAALPIGVCETIDAPRAQRCPVRAFCFAQPPYGGG